MNRRSLRTGFIATFSLFIAASTCVYSQSTASLTQTVNQRNTIGVLSASPVSGLTTGEAVTFSYVLHTAGAPAPTSETIQFYDGASAIGAAQSIGSLSGSNLLPYSQVNIANGWTMIGSPTVAASTDAGPDGSSASAAKLTLPSSSAQNQGVSYAVSGASYASESMTLIFWAKASSAVTLTMGITDNPALNANGSGACALTTSYQRCTLTYSFPSNANAGFVVNLYTSLQAAAVVDVWGVQVEQANSAGPYVSTIGAARPTGGQGGSVSYAYSGLSNGAHSITAVYGGDTNFIGSTSNAVSLSVGLSTPSISLSPSAASPSTYGDSLTFTVTLAGGAGYPTGAVQLMNGATSLGSATLSNRVATITLSGASALGGGSYSLTAVYAGDANYNSATSATLPYTINKASSSSLSFGVVSSGSPSTYGDSVTFTSTLASTVGAATPTGSVSIYDNLTSTSLGSFTLNGSGVATATIPLFSAGSHNLTFTYSGDSNYQ